VSGVPARGRRVAVGLLTGALLAVLALGGWTAQRWVAARAVLQHPVVEILADQGWPVEQDTTFRAGPLDRLFLGGMIEHPLQRQVRFAPAEERAGVLTVVVEDLLFGVRGEPELAAHGLRWQRQLVSGNAVRYTGQPPASASTRLERVTVTISSGEVEVRTFGR
jgi:hypothetical protein